LTSRGWGAPYKLQILKFPTIICKIREVYTCLRRHALIIRFFHKIQGQRWSLNFDFAKISPKKPYTKNHGSPFNFFVPKVCHTFFHFKHLNFQNTPTLAFWLSGWKVFSIEVFSSYFFWFKTTFLTYMKIDQLLLAANGIWGKYRFSEIFKKNDWFTSFRLLLNKLHDLSDTLFSVCHAPLPPLQPL
jgi:hypothetical protein